ncbi:hypothetical protein [Alloalcanivorax balearicus]|nr:hypothetical protein [Alloalcanivorax balearicus]
MTDRSEHAGDRIGHGGMISAPLLSMLVVPAAYYLMRRNRRPE